ncbi:MAG: SMP-30/gluconolactonase/LRE family protein [Streptosporangiaceae bacterium]
MPSRDCEQVTAAAGRAAGHAVALPVPPAELGEGPCWEARSQSLFWIDVPAGLVYRIDAAGDLARWDVGQPVGAVMTRAAGGLVLAARDGFLALDLDSGAATLLASVEADLPGNRMNDGACDRAGRYYAGTMAADERPGAGALYRLDPDLTMTRLLTGIGISNGIGWSPDERLMYYVDSLDYQVDVLDYDAASGAIRGRRPFARVGQDGVLPDGLTVDAEGGVWVALWGGGALRRYAPDGTLTREVPFPHANVTSCAFGGPGLELLYVTTAAGPGAEAGGGLFVLEPGVAGQPSYPFRG